MKIRSRVWLILSVFIIVSFSSSVVFAQSGRVSLKGLYIGMPTSELGDFMSTLPSIAPHLSKDGWNLSDPTENTKSHLIPGKFLEVVKYNTEDRVYEMIYISSDDSHKITGIQFAPVGTGELFGVSEISPEDFVNSFNKHFNVNLRRNYDVEWKEWKGKDSSGNKIEFLDDFNIYMSKSSSVNF